jgi:hypothetical protein
MRAGAVRSLSRSDGTAQREPCLDPALCPQGWPGLAAADPCSCRQAVAPARGARVPHGGVPGCRGFPLHHLAAFAERGNGRGAREEAAGGARGGRRAHGGVARVNRRIQRSVCLTAAQLQPEPPPARGGSQPGSAAPQIPCCKPRRRRSRMPFRRRYSTHSCSRALSEVGWSRCTRGSDTVARRTSCRGPTCAAPWCCAQGAAGETAKHGIRPPLRRGCGGEGSDVCQETLPGVPADDAWQSTRENMMASRA